MLNAVYPIIGNESDFPIYVTGAGVSEPEYDVKREAGLVSHQFLYTKSGSGVLIVDGERFLLHEGSLMYLSPGVPHHYYPENGNWTTCWVVFRGRELSGTMSALGFGRYAVRSDAVSEEIRSLFTQILASAKNPLGAEKSSALVYELALACRRALLFPKSPAVSPFDSVLGFIDRNYAGDITLEQLSKLAGVSVQHLCRVFRARTGMRPTEYIARRRLGQAKALLLNTNESIAAIGALSGYPDPSYFGMVFRKFEGISPSEYRSNKGSGVL